MLTVAAISYMIEQNEPSRPFLLDLDIPEEPTAEQLRDALIASDQAARREAIPNLPPLPLLVCREDRWGDLVVGQNDPDGSGDGTYLFVGLPDRLRGLCAAFPDRASLGI